MEGRGIFNGRGFWALALLWLPAGVVAQALVRFQPQADPGLPPAMLPMLAGSLVLIAPCGLPLALGCRRVCRLGYRRGARWAWIVLGVLTVAASVVAGLLGPVAIAVYAIVLSLPVWGHGGGSRIAADGRRRRAGCAAGGNGGLSVPGGRSTHMWISARRRWICGEAGEGHLIRPSSAPVLMSGSVRPILRRRWMPCWTDMSARSLSSAGFWCTCLWLSAHRLKNSCTEPKSWKSRSPQFRQ